jgi:hypothetical protein
MKDIADKVVGKLETHVLRPIYIFLKRALYEILWKNIVDPVRPQTTIWRMRIAFWIPKAINTEAEYVIIISIPIQQRLQERNSSLRYT